jgi:hypothetical protein
MATQPAKSDTGKWSVGDIVGLVGGMAGIVGVIVGVLAWLAAKESNRIAAEAQAVSQKTYDRAAGKIPARLVVEGFGPPYGEIPAEMKFQSPLGVEAVRLKSLDSLRELNPRLVVRNAGDEVIEALRVETRLSFLGLRDPSRPGEKQWGARKAWTFNRGEREDLVLSKKLLPGQTATIPLVRGMTLQMLQGQTGGFEESDRYGQFEVRCYARIVGATAFDESEREATIVISLVWQPNGFPEDQCKKFLDGYEPLVEITDGH